MFRRRLFVIAIVFFLFAVFNSCTKKTTEPQVLNFQYLHFNAYDELVPTVQIVTTDIWWNAYSNQYIVFYDLWLGNNGTVDWQIVDIIFSGEALGFHLIDPYFTWENVVMNPSSGGGRRFEPDIGYASSMPSGQYNTQISITVAEVKDGNVDYNNTITKTLEIIIGVP